MPESVEPLLHEVSHTLPRDAGAHWGLLAGATESHHDGVFLGCNLNDA